MTAKKHNLMGDGKHDDTQAIQKLLDTSARVVLPMPDVCYLISRPLEVRSDQEIILGRFCHIKLADSSNCVMLKNSDCTGVNFNISISGGIWDMNNQKQQKNPFHNPHPDCPEYNGYAMSFCNIRNFRLAHMTIKDPVTFAITLDKVNDFTVEDINFDFNYGNPKPINMDGVHLNGDCHFGVIRNIKGACYDDMIALNADEGSGGLISHIEIDGLFARNCHSAVRMLSCKYPVTDVTVENVHGTFYQYCIGLTKYYDGASEGYFDGISIKNIFASKAPRWSVYCKDGTVIYPFIWAESGTDIKNVSISNIYRVENTTAAATVGIDEGAAISNMVLRDICQQNQTETSFAVISNKGSIKHLRVDNIDAGLDIVLENSGEIGEFIRN